MVLIFGIMIDFVMAKPIFNYYYYDQIISELFIARSLVKDSYSHWRDHVTTTPYGFGSYLVSPVQGPLESY